MHAIHPRTQPHVALPVTGPFPWEEGHAAPEDRAVGLELELIELVHRRENVRDDQPAKAEAIDAEIDRTLARLGDIAPALPLAV